MRLTNETPGSVEVSDDGIAVVMALLVTSALLALGLGLAVLSNTEAQLAGHFRSGGETFYAADAALARVIRDVAVLPDWTPVVAGALGAIGWDGPAAPVFLDLAAMTSGIQAMSDASTVSGADRPRWRLLGYGSLAGLVGDADLRSPATAAVWAADDPADADGDPGADANGIVTVVAQAVGANGTRTTLEATLARVVVESESGTRETTRVLSWREIP